MTHSNKPQKSSPPALDGGEVLTPPDSQVLQQVRQGRDALQAEVGQVLMHHQHVIDQLLTVLLCREHCLLEGAAGLGKALAVRTLARCLRLDLHRIEFTSDLTPEEVFSIEAAAAGHPLPPGDPARQGALAAHILLADQFHRAAPKAQAALLNAIEEQRVLLAGHEYALPDPLLVVATQNPLDPPASTDLLSDQQDRFLFKILMQYPGYQDEYGIAEISTAQPPQPPRPILSVEQIRHWQRLVPRIVAPPPVIHYALRLVRATRIHEGETPDFIYEWISWGAGPRGVQCLLLAAKARALLDGRPAATGEDIRALAHPVLRHRLITNDNARSNGVTADDVIDRLLAEVPLRWEGDEQPPQGSRTPPCRAD